MQYRITVTGIGSEEIATAMANHLDANGQAFRAFIDIVVTNDTEHAAIVWDNHQTTGCDHCGGFGYTDDDGDVECPVCLGNGAVDAR